MIAAALVFLLAGAMVQKYFNSTILRLLLIHQTPAALGRAQYCYTYEILAPLTTSLSTSTVTLYPCRCHADQLCFCCNACICMPSVAVQLAVFADLHCCYIWGCLQYCVGRHLFLLLFFKRALHEFHPISPCHIFFGLCYLCQHLNLT